MIMANATFLAQINPAPSHWAERLQKLADFLKPMTGPWIGNEVAFGITWVQIVGAAGVIIVTLIIAGILRAIMHARIRVEEKKAASLASDETAPIHVAHEHWWHAWLKLILEAAVPPLMLFICVCGFYAALRLLLVQVQNDNGPSGWLVALRWLKNTGNFIALFWFLFRLVSVVDVQLKHWAARTTRKWDDVIAALIGRAMRLLIPLLGIIFIVPTLNIPDAYHDILRQASSVLLIAAIGFILYQLAATMEQAVMEQYRIDVKDNLETRKIQTQVRVLKRIAVTVIVLFTTASILMVFDSVRQLGTSLLASAGVAGIIIGFAAQRSIGTIFAGVQIAFTQPIRIDDVVIVENEWGRIEEITMTYVIVKIWDLRRLVVPITYFIEKPFQNWTRTSADILGSIMLYVDYTTPLKPLRDEMDRILENSKLWDRKVKVLQVTDSKERTIELRVLVSAADAGTAWDLRCQVREQLVDFLQRNYPQCLPRIRAEMESVAEATQHKPQNTATETPNAQREANLLDKPA